MTGGRPKTATFSFGGAVVVSVFCFVSWAGRGSGLCLLSESGRASFGGVLGCGVLGCGVEVFGDWVFGDGVDDTGGLAGVGWFADGVLGVVWSGVDGLGAVWSGVVREPGVVLVGGGVGLVVFRSGVGAGPCCGDVLGGEVTVFGGGVGETGGLGPVWFGVVWFGVVWFGVVWFGVVWFGAVWFGVVPVFGVGDFGVWSAVGDDGVLGAVWSGVGLGVVRGGVDGWGPGVVLVGGGVGLVFCPGVGRGAGPCCVVVFGDGVPTGPLLPLVG